jgi:hypothetical protein
MFVYQSNNASLIKSLEIMNKVFVGLWGTLGFYNYTNFIIKVLLDIQIQTILK